MNKKLYAIDLAVKAVQLIKTLTAQHPETQWTLQYSPEAFSATELDFALAVCNAVSEAWGATPDNKVILNLPATVEVATPNVYADQIEWMHTHLARRDSVIVSVHPHNDRGTAVAAAEINDAWERNNWKLFTVGNDGLVPAMWLVTLTLNLYCKALAQFGLFGY